MSKETQAAPAEKAQQAAPEAEQEQIQEGTQGAAPEGSQDGAPEGAGPAAKEQAPLAARLQAAQERAAAALNELCSLMRNEVGRPVIFPVQALQLFKFTDEPAAPFQPETIQLEREPFLPEPGGKPVPRELIGPKQISTDHSLRTRKAQNIQAPGIK